jgi:hypothetical protein
MCQLSDIVTYQGREARIVGVVNPSSKNTLHVRHDFVIEFKDTKEWAKVTKKDIIFCQEERDLPTA